MPFLFWRGERRRTRLVTTGSGSELAQRISQAHPEVTRKVLPAGKGSIIGDASVIQTSLEHELSMRKAKAKTVAALMKSAPSAGLDRPYIPAQLEGALFVGHLVTDLDSIAGALGAAALYGGVPARASEVNSETAFALERFGVEAPQPIETLIVSQPEAGVCLVDHQQRSQLNPAVDMERIVGIIDHHALQSQTIVSDKPIYIDIRPWVRWEGTIPSAVARKAVPPAAAAAAACPAPPLPNGRAAATPLLPSCTEARAVLTLAGLHVYHHCPSGKRRTVMRTPASRSIFSPAPRSRTLRHPLACVVVASASWSRARCGRLAITHAAQRLRSLATT